MPTRGFGFGHLEAVRRVIAPDSAPAARLVPQDLGLGPYDSRYKAEILKQGVAGLLATQTPDGYIGTYKDGKHLAIWDVWGRKYTMLGLIAVCDLTGNRRSLEAACRVADHLLKLVMCDYASAGNGWSGVRRAGAMGCQTR
ncbi:MAG: glycoside hydrolase family 127 protein [Akkermansiaceae bacterium]|jgi:hypothetical protein|nr:glycoside hydrolase family 127 protein [Akkermansiaceae bacterium]